MAPSRSNGKLILLGEHAVVYGLPAIAAGIDRGAAALARPDERSSIRVLEREAEIGDGSELGRALEALLEALSAPPMRIEVDVELPLGCGLGGSAALGVAAARSVLDVRLGREPEASPETPERTRAVLDAAMAWERVFHGNPSGVDAATAALGGCLFFSKASGPQRVTLGAPLELAVAIAGPPASTREMVESVARLRDRRPEVVEKALEGIHALVRNARLCLEAGDLNALGKLLNLNQMLLSGLFLSTEDIERACALAREAGALGAKLTGSGGGGAVIALTPGGSGPVVEAWSRAGYPSFGATVHPVDARPPSWGER